MKLSTLFLFGCLTSASVFAQTGTTYTDDFSKSKDFMADGVTGTIWDGYYFNFDKSGGDAETLNALKTDDDAGALVIDATGTSWGPDAANGPFLYKDLKDVGADFECTVKIVGGDFQTLGATAVPYFMPGIMVRAKDADVNTTSQIQAFDRSEWSAVYRSLNAPDVDGTAAGDNSWTPRNTTLASLGLTIADADFTVKNFPYMKLKKEGEDITAFVSSDDKTWLPIWKTARPDLTLYKLEVGLAHSSNSDQKAIVIFDDFSLTDYSVNSAVKEITNDQAKVFYSNHAVTVNSSNSTIAKVNVYTVDGRLVKMVNGLNSNKCNVSMNQRGFYIVAVETSKGRQVQKISVTE